MRVGWLQVQEWLPEELRDASSAARNRMQVELKGSTVVSYVFQTVTVRPAFLSAALPVSALRRDPLHRLREPAGMQQGAQGSSALVRLL